MSICIFSAFVRTLMSVGHNAVCFTVSEFLYVVQHLLSVNRWLEYLMDVFQFNIYAHCRHGNSEFHNLKNCNLQIFLLNTYIRQYHTPSLVEIYHVAWAPLSHYLNQWGWGGESNLTCHNAGHLFISPFALYGYLWKESCSIFYPMTSPNGFVNPKTSLVH